MVQPLFEIKKVKKTNRTFNRFQSDRFKRVGTSWRKPRGIDNRVRKKYSGAIKMPGIGYGCDKVTRHLVEGFRKVQIRNMDDLLALASQNKFYAGEIAHSVGAKKRIELFYKAAELDIKLFNGEARLERRNGD
ncbi:50S ribosomal L32 [Tubulinosema ratisbonensis]|uniref:50S ribosomal L32 n=1 Tax=Tubulinosema ratisbonensis TaxID=291195 RepID=A0A437AJT6_9MICR|nr:50S ribosomal L32 [Tubulinosema ratisbonensis]